MEMTPTPAKDLDEEHLLLEEQTKATDGAFCGLLED
jgi:hypothetical protein